MSEDTKQDYSKLSLRDRKLLIMENVGSLPKDGWNETQGFSYTTHNAFKRAVRAMFLKYGIYFTLNTPEKPDLLQPSKGFSVLFFYRITLSCLVDGVLEEETIDSYGHGVDVYDKAFPKAKTYAIKAFLQDMFLIESGDADPEGQNPDVTPKKTKAQTGLKNKYDKSDSKGFPPESYFSSPEKLAFMIADLADGRRTPQEIMSLWEKTDGLNEADKKAGFSAIQIVFDKVVSQSPDMKGVGMTDKGGAVRVFPEENQ